MPKNYEMPKKELYTDELHAAIKAELGDKFLGLSTDETRVIFHLADDASGQDVSKAMLKFAEHDVATLPPRVQPKTHEQRIAELEAKIAQLLEQRGGGNPP